jgi:hypothetical protein
MSMVKVYLWTMKSIQDCPGFVAQLPGKRVSLTMERFDDLIKNDKDEVFKNSIQKYVEYPKELK